MCHLESRLQMRFAPRSSGQITFALGFRCTQGFFQDLFIKLFKSLAPGRAAGGILKPCKQQLGFLNLLRAARRALRVLRGFARNTSHEYRPNFVGTEWLNPPRALYLKPWTWKVPGEPLLRNLPRRAARLPTGPFPNAYRRLITPPWEECTEGFYWGRHP